MEPQEQATEEGKQQVINWVSRLVLDLAVDPDAVSIKARDGHNKEEGTLIIEVFAPRRQMGRLIGREGHTSSAIRTLVSSYAYARGIPRVSIRMTANDEARLSDVE